MCRRGVSNPQPRQRGEGVTGRTAWVHRTPRPDALPLIVSLLLLVPILRWRQEYRRLQTRSRRLGAVAAESVPPVTQVGRGRLMRPTHQRYRHLHARRAFHLRVGYSTRGLRKAGPRSICRRRPRRVISRSRQRLRVKTGCYVSSLGYHRPILRRVFECEPPWPCVSRPLQSCENVSEAVRSRGTGRNRW